MIHRVMPQIVERLQWCVLVAVVLLLNSASVKAMPMALPTGEVLSQVADVKAGGDSEIGGDVTNVSLDYDPRASLGVVELSVSPLLTPGGLVIGAFYGELEFPADRSLEGSGGWETDVVAMAAAIPEPDTFALIAFGVALLAARRFVKAGTRRRV